MEAEVRYLDVLRTAQLDLSQLERPRLEEITRALIEHTSGILDVLSSETRQVATIKAQQATIEALQEQIVSLHGTLAALSATIATVGSGEGKHRETILSMASSTMDSMIADEPFVVSLVYQLREAVLSAAAGGDLDPSDALVAFWREFHFTEDVDHAKAPEASAG